MSYALRDGRSNTALVVAAAPRWPTHTSETMYIGDLPPPSPRSRCHFSPQNCANTLQ